MKININFDDTDYNEVDRVYRMVEILWKHALEDKVRYEQEMEQLKKGNIGLMRALKK